MTAAVETGLVWRAPLAFVLLVPLVLAAWARVRARVGVTLPGALAAAPGAAPLPVTSKIKPEAEVDRSTVTSIGPIGQSTILVIVNRSFGAPSENRTKTSACAEVEKSRGSIIKPRISELLSVGPQMCRGGRKANKKPRQLAGLFVLVET